MNEFFIEIGTTLTKYVTVPVILVSSIIYIIKQLLNRGGE